MPTSRANPSAVTVLLTALGVGLSGALMPGPLTVVALHQAMGIGMAAGVLVGSTHAALELLMVLALGAGLGRLLVRPANAVAIAVAGGLALLAMSWQMMTVTPALTAATHPGTGMTPSGPLLGGAIATLGNPYWFLWWATIGASQIAWAGRRHRLVFWLGHITADVAWLTALAAAVSQGRGLLTGPAYSLLVQGLGAMVGILGLYFLAGAPRLARGGASGGAVPRQESGGRPGRRLGE